MGMGGGERVGLGKQYAIDASFPLYGYSNQPIMLPFLGVLDCTKRYLAYRMPTIFILLVDLC